MKIKKIAKQLDEHARLERLIRDLDMVLKDFDKMEEPKPAQTDTMNVLHTTSVSMYFVEDPEGNKIVNIGLNPNITKLVCEEIKEILLRHRVDLKKKQDKLEV